MFHFVFSIRLGSGVTIFTPHENILKMFTGVGKGQNNSRQYDPMTPRRLVVFFVYGPHWNAVRVLRSERLTV